MMASQLWSEWWVWLSAALVLGILEVLLPGFIFLGFALGAAAMGLLLASGFLSLTASWSLVVFAVLSLIAYIGLRMVFGLKTGQVKKIDRDINDN